MKAGARLSSDRKALEGMPSEELTGSRGRTIPKHDHPPGGLVRHIVGEERAGVLPFGREGSCKQRGEAGEGKAGKGWLTRKTSSAAAISAVAFNRRVSLSVFTEPRGLKREASICFFPSQSRIDLSEQSGSLRVSKPVLSNSRKAPNHLAKVSIRCNSSSEVATLISTPW